MGNKNKKGNATWFLASIVVTVLSFIVYLIFFMDLGQNVVTEMDDIACRNLFTTIKSTPQVKMGEFFYQINNKCKTNKITLRSDVKEEVFETVALSMSRCWYRYGEGEFDFLSNWKTEGNWCFLCGTIDFKGEGKEANSYSFNDYIDWTEKNKFMLSNGTETSYYDYINMKYANIESGELDQLNRDVLELIRDSEGNDKNALVMLAQQERQLYDLRLKEIDPNHKTYVVYRYDRIDESTLQKIFQGATTGLVGMGVSIGVGALVENVLWMGGSAIVCGTAGWSIPVAGQAACGGMLAATAAKIANSGRKAVSAISRVTRFNKVALKIKDSVVMSRRAEKVLAITEDLVDFASKAKLVEAASNLAKIDPELAEKMTKVVSVMEDLGIDNLDELESTIEFTVGNIENLKGLVNEKTAKLARAKGNKKKLRYESQIENNEAGIELLEKQLSDFEKLELDMNEILKIEPTKWSTPQKASVIDYIKSVPVIATTVVAGYVGSGLDFEKNQYVDLMTQEQYYRLCGTEPASFK